jgi:hypothetical protein
MWSFLHALAPDLDARTVRGSPSTDNVRGTASSDDVEPATGIEYQVRVNGAINEVIPGGTQTVTYTEVLGVNTVTIVAVDGAGNASVPSNAMTVVTNWAPGGCGL